MLLCAVALVAHVPTPLPAWYETHHHTQPVDHFNFENNATFAERYLVNRTWWAGPPAPIIFYTGAEGDGVDTIFPHSGPVVELARSLGALLVFAEMRFFGTSMPFGEWPSMELSIDRLGLLSIEQALADYAALIVALRAQHGADASPVICIGGSLAGTLTFFMRAKYPHLVDMALAASAPILGYPSLTSPYGWYRVATSTYEKQAPGCVDAVRRRFTALLAAPAPNLTASFNACAPIAAADAPAVAEALVSRLTGTLASKAESAYPLATSPVVRACAAIMDPAVYGAAAFRPFVVAPGQCYDPSKADEIGGRPRASAWPGARAPLPPLRGPATGGTAWYYLACTEIVHPIAANNVTDMFPPQPWSVEGLSAECERLFHVSPRPSWMPSTMGMGRLSELATSVTRVIFSNGMLDPWSAQARCRRDDAAIAPGDCAERTRRSTALRSRRRAQSVTSNLSSSLIAINIADGSHHSDLGSPPNPTVTDADSVTVKDARADELRILKGWLADATAERAAPMATKRARESPVVERATATAPAAPAAPPPSMPPGAIDWGSPVLHDIFAAGCGFVGLVMAFTGERTWRTFLGLAAFASAGGLTFYEVHTLQTSIALWAAALIGCGVGLAATIIAVCLDMISWMAASAGAGAVAAFGTCRALGAPHDVRLVAVGAAALVCVVGAYAVASACFKRCAGTTAAAVAQQRGQHNKATSRPPGRLTCHKLRRAGDPASVAEAIVSAVVGAYGVLFCANNWFPEDLGPDAIFAEGPSPTCDTRCLGFLGGAAVLAAVGATSQVLVIRARRTDKLLEASAIAEPLTDVNSPPYTHAPSTNPDSSMTSAHTSRSAMREWRLRGGRGAPPPSSDEYNPLATPPPRHAERESALAARMREKYAPPSSSSSRWS